MNGMRKGIGYVNLSRISFYYYKLIYLRLKQICYDYKYTRMPYRYIVCRYK
jgi:hypothetical protein